MGTITRGTSTLTPLLVLTCTSTSSTGSTVHQLAGGGVAITVTGIGKRSGVITLLLVDSAAVVAAEIFFAAVGPFTLTDPGILTGSLTFALGEGDLEPALDTDTQLRWTFAVPYQEL